VDHLANVVRRINMSTGVITRVAGITNERGHTGSTAQATSTLLNGPTGVIFDPAGNMYITEGMPSHSGDFHDIRKVTPSGVISTWAGAGPVGHTGDGGSALSATFNVPEQMAFDAAGNLYVSESGGHTVRRITPAGIISSVVGTGASGSSGDGGPATAATLVNPRHLSFDQAGNLYIADSGAARIRRVDRSGTITLYAGTGGTGSTGDGGQASAAEVGQPHGLAYDGMSGNLYFTEGMMSGKLRRIAAYPMTKVVTYGYDLEDRVVTETMPDGSRTYSYGTSGSGAGHLVGYTQTLPGASITTTLTYDGSGHIATETTDGVTTSYGYDAAGQLTSSSPDTGPASSWTYDELGRRATETVGSTPSTYRYDDANQLCWIAVGTSSNPCGTPPSGATTYTYDSAGRRLSEYTSPTDNVSYTYDPVGRLSTLTRVGATATTTQTRAYDPDDALAAISTPGGTSTSTGLAWDKSLPVPQLRSLGSTTLVYGADRWAGAGTSGTWASIGIDVYGSAVPTAGRPDLAVTDAYDAWGEATAPSPEPTLGYRGELTLDGLTNLRARDYDPATGAFTSVDPLDGVDGTPAVGQGNSYTYSENEPLLRTDPTGQQSEDDLFFKDPPGSETQSQIAAYTGPDLGPWHYQYFYILAVNDPRHTNDRYAAKVMGWLQQDPKRYFPFQLGGDHPRIVQGAVICTKPGDGGCSNVQVEDVEPRYFRFRALPGHIEPVNSRISFFIDTIRDVKNRQVLYLRVHAWGQHHQLQHEVFFRFAPDLWSGMSLALQHDILGWGKPRP
jgi:RHS repeat-associated protein